jgi:adenosylcobinamide kinase/adenosylcobinamide-phosphate guanylyltransferase
VNASRIILVTGGGRSGKSSYAQRVAQAVPGRRVYVATATPFDAELQERVAKHQDDRLEGGWSATIEEPVSLTRAIRQAPSFGVILVDCLTMWVGNLMWAAERDGRAALAAGESGLADASARAETAASTDAAALTEGDIAGLCQEVVAAARERGGTAVFVTNEVGLGIIPDNPAARLYRDLLGRCNQVMAVAADTVVFMVSGLPLMLKGRDPLGSRGDASS